ncbi:MAG: adenylate/guanylate cyclase domain-containing protein [Vicinamibacteria bacterium]
MAHSSPLVKGFAPTRFIEGSQEEAERLLGGSLPPLPAGELAEREEIVYYVQHHPHLRGFAQGYLTHLLLELCPEAKREGVGPAPARAEQDYAGLLERTLVNSLMQDRRIGLVNLFWLSHSKEIADVMARLTAATPTLQRARFAIHPLLASFLRNVWQSACREVERGRPGFLRFLLGRYVQVSLADAIIDDQLPLTLADVGEVDFAAILTNNSRYRISVEIFSEIYDLLYKEIEARVLTEDPLFLARVARHLPSIERESYLLPAHMTRMLFNAETRRHLLSDVWGFGSKLTKSRLFKSQVDAGVNPLTLLEVFDELAHAVQRFEIISHVRDHIRLLPSVTSEAQINEQFGPVRFYRYSESVEVSGNAVNATVMFLDLRGFTKTSEGLVSERDLTRELYGVFDRFVEIIDRFGGEVDKFLGDGMMITFGAGHSSRYGALNALRTAILLQEKIAELRKEGQTEFTMGVSIHHGRVYLAHFIGSSGDQDTTVIGRNVNVAGRLSSASKVDGKASDEARESGEDRDQDGERSGKGEGGRGLVRIDGRGSLFNEGIAVSRETVRAVEEVLPLTRRDDVQDLYGEFYDPSVKKTVRLRYVGEAKFKGVWGSLPVYSVDYGERV